MLKVVNKTSGFTLIELIISLLLGSILLAMLVGLYTTSVSATAKAMKFSRLRTDLQAIVALMENDIRRAGYGGSEFMVGEGHNKVIDTINTDLQKCIVYSYNYDDTAAISQSYFMAFRYSYENKSIQFGRKLDPNAANCFSSGNWKNLTDPNFMKVTMLSIVESSTTNAQATTRSVAINIEAELVENSDYKHQIQTKVKVRNLEFY